MTFKCFKCGQDIVFNAMQVGKTGKKIPLDPSTELPHECPMSGYNKEKDDHGKENEQTPTSAANEQKIKNANGNGGYVDHTQGIKEKLKLKVLTDPTPEGLSHLYNSFGESHNIRFSQYHPQGSLYTMAVWYEEIPLKQ